MAAGKTTTSTYDAEHGVQRTTEEVPMTTYNGVAMPVEQAAAYKQQDKVRRQMLELLGVIPVKGKQTYSDTGVFGDVTGMVSGMADGSYNPFAAFFPQAPVQPVQPGGPSGGAPPLTQPGGPSGGAPPLTQPGGPSGTLPPPGTPSPPGGGGVYGFLAGREQQALNMILQQGGSERARIARDAASALGSATANLESRGLGSSSLAPAAQSAVDEVTQQANLALFDELLGQALGTQQRTTDLTTDVAMQDKQIQAGLLTSILGGLMPSFNISAG